MEEQRPSYARFERAHGRWQSVADHLNGVAKLTAERCDGKTPVLARLAGLLHDVGKWSQPFQQYLHQAAEDPDSVHRGEVDHSTAGGVLADGMTHGTMVSQLLQTVIYSHHGVQDCLSPQGESLFEKRLSASKRSEIQFEEVEKRSRDFYDSNELAAQFQTAQKQLSEVLKEICVLGSREQGRYGSRDFYLGAYARVLLSLVVDGDRTDAACFDQNIPLPEEESDPRRQKRWRTYIQRLEERLTSFDQTTEIGRQRAEISRLCQQAANRDSRLFRLNVPTGGGKTLSSLRFALHHALRFHKKRIFYIAPYCSIIDQNADVLRDALGEQGVLEHHSNVMHEDPKQQGEYDRLTENWDAPVIVTTLVQMLNTLFSSKTASVRRMHSLCHSVLIFDEVQTLPIRLVHLFNLAVNFLTEFCGATVVLCSATQPLLDQVEENRLLPPEDMIPADVQRAAVFQRTVLIDRAQDAVSAEDLADFVWEQFVIKQQVLVIVNTKACARRVYQGLKERAEETCLLAHLSTNMCMAHREQTLQSIADELNNKRPVILISTPLVEAGVDISFRCVVRSLAGLDSIVQAAGRCNRNGEDKLGEVHIVKLLRESENVSSLPDVVKAQEAIEILLAAARRDGVQAGEFLSSPQAIQQYYQTYFYRRAGEMGYLVSVDGEQTTLTDLLSQNRTGTAQYRRTKGRECWQKMKQAFRTAGDRFEVIPEDGGFDVIVEYGGEPLILLRNLENETDPKEKKRVLKQLQRYTVSISEGMLKTLGGAVHPMCQGMVFLLKKRYYCEETGVVTQPAAMELLGF